MPNKEILPRLIVGLGNPGSQYEHTRHNVGVDFLNKLADTYRINLSLESKFQGLTGRGLIEGNDVRLLFPTTYMNESGRAVSALCTFYKIAPEEILVVHDDLDLKPGQMKLKTGGGFAGHNGLKSIGACMGNTQNFLRLRIGIGMPPSHDVISWVLGRCAPNDRDNIDEAFGVAINAIKILYTQGLQKATMMVNGFKPQIG